MTEVITAVYEEGILRPLDPVNLREHQAVRIQVLAEEPKNEGEEAIRVLVKAGLMRRPERDDPPPNPVSGKDRLALAERIGQLPGKPLSEIIIEERGEW
jgi:predicted DNA-binding antitoxin AbrB/MazE fold protein